MITVLALFQWFAGIPGAAEFLGSVVALLVAAGSLYKLVVIPLRKHFNRVNAGMDTLLGYPAVHDPGSGRQIQPPTPPLASRVYDLEVTNKEIADALLVIANNQKHLVELQEELDIRKQAGDAIINDYHLWRQDVDERMRVWAVEQDELAKIVRQQMLES